MANKQQLIQIFAILTLLVEVLSVASLYVPDIGHPLRARGHAKMMRREDNDDEDDMDSNASAPYQNQDDGAGGQQDGYEESEPDGPYGETPREEEGQADLERFFDDHLGASERDGMDKENLPSNIVEYVSVNPRKDPASRQPFIYNLASLPKPTVVNHPMVAQSSKPLASYSRRPQTNNVEMRYLKLPDDRVIIVHHEERDLAHNPDVQSATGEPPRSPSTSTRVPGEILQQSFKTSPATENLRRSDNNFGDRIVVAENDDDEKVYVTRAINKPFKINGYDPEQDFQDAERDLDGPPTSTNSGSSRRRSGKDRRDAEAEAPVSRDISFNDGETDTMFNDASETDEITFAQDDPYQTDLEAEMRSQAFDKPTPPAPVAATLKEAPEVRIAPRRRSADPSRSRQDEAEGSWINDGVDEMDIPSQSHQDKVLEKAAKQQEAAAAAEAVESAGPERRYDYEEPRDETNPDESPAETASDYQEQPASDDDGQESGQESNQIDPENQRMPNANYLKNFSDEPDEYEDNDAL